MRVMQHDFMSLDIPARYPVMERRGLLPSVFGFQAQVAPSSGVAGSEASAGFPEQHEDI